MNNTDIGYSIVCQLKSISGSIAKLAKLKEEEMKLKEKEIALKETELGQRRNNRG